MYFDQATRKSLKKAYAKAQKERAESFNFYGQEILTRYAKYLLEYFDMQIKKGAGNGEQSRTLR